MYISLYFFLLCRQELETRVEQRINFYDDEIIIHTRIRYTQKQSIFVEHFR